MYEIGKITTTHGIKGELKIINLSDFDRFKANDKVYIIYEEQEISLTVEKVRSHKNYLIVKFKEYNNINDVLKYKGLIVYSKERAKLSENEFYHEDLIGLNVYTNTNLYLGIVQDVIELPHGHILEVDSKETKRVLIPFVSEFIVEVNISNKKIIIKPIEGLIWLSIL